MDLNSSFSFIFTYLYINRFFVLLVCKCILLQYLWFVQVFYYCYCRSLVCMYWLMMIFGFVMFQILVCLHQAAPEDLPLIVFWYWLLNYTSTILFFIFVSSYFIFLASSLLFVPRLYIFLHYFCQCLLLCCWKSERTHMLL